MKTHPRPDDASGALGEVAAHRSIGWQAVPRLARLLMSSDDVVVDAAALAIADLLDDVRVTRLQVIDRAIRSAWLSLALRPEDVAALRAPPAARPSALGVFSFAASGYTRQAAVQRLSRFDTGRELPFLLIRVNDWVSEVRSEAQLAVNARIRADYAPHLVRCLPLVAALARAERFDHHELIGRIEALLLGAGRTALRDGVASADPNVRRAVLDVVLRGGRAASDEIPDEVRVALEDSDPVVAQRAVRYFCAAASDAEFRQLLPRLAALRHARCRVDVLEALATRRTEGAVGWFEAALFDRSPGVRATARYCLRDRPDLLTPDRYLAALQSEAPASLLGAIWGLGEVGTREHAPALGRYLASDFPSAIRQRALRSLVRLQGRATIDLLVEHLGDGQPGLSRTARDLLVRLSAGGVEHQLEGLLGSSHAAHVRRNALVVLLGLGKWRELLWSLRALEASDHPGKELALHHVVAWSSRANRSFTPASAAEVAEIRERVRALGGVLPAPTAGLILWIVDREN